MKFQFLILSIVLLIGIAGCEFFKAEVKSISVEEAYELLDNDPDIIVVDVRTPEEYRGGYIGNAKNFDISASDFETNISSLGKEDKIMVVCASGVRSKEAAEYLTDKGYKNVFEVKGGLNEWKRKGMKVKIGF